MRSGERPQGAVGDEGFPDPPLLASFCERADSRGAMRAPGLYAAGQGELNIVPRGSFASAHNRPPWASMIDRQIDKPHPCPLAFVGLEGSENALNMSGGMPCPDRARPQRNTCLFLRGPINSSSRRCRQPSPCFERVHSEAGSFRDHLLQLNAIAP